MEKMTNKGLLLLFITVSIVLLAFYDKVDANTLLGLILGAMSKGILDDMYDRKGILDNILETKIKVDECKEEDKE